MSRPRAGVVVTGTEVLTGRVADRNGPWLAERLREIGVDVAATVVVGDRPDDLRRALAWLADVDLVITSGGLGPTADDLTAEVVAGAQGRPLELDPALQARIAAIVERLSAGRGWRVDPAARDAATRKQALVPDGATVLEPVGTAPGLVVPVAAGRSGPPVVVLPGPPPELRGMWPAAVAADPVVAVVGGAEELRQRTVRLFGTLEASLAATLRDHDDELVGLEITTCLRGGELEVVSRYAPAAQPAQDALAAALAAEYGEAVFSPDGRTVDQLVTDALRERGWLIATAESCTGGLLAARLTDPPGASRYVAGGVVAYSNDVKTAALDVDPAVLARHGAVSEPVAVALAEGVCRRLGADVGVGITGVAGPDGGTLDKPVGLVHLAVHTPDGTMHQQVRLPGSRADVRERAVTVAMHLVRRALGG